MFIGGTVMMPIDSAMHKTMLKSFNFIKLYHLVPAMPYYYSMGA